MGLFLGPVRPMAWPGQMLGVGGGAAVAAEKHPASRAQRLRDHRGGALDHIRERDDVLQARAASPRIAAAAPGGLADM